MGKDHPRQRHPTISLAKGALAFVCGVVVGVVVGWTGQQPATPTPPRALDSPPPSGTLGGGNMQRVLEVVRAHEDAVRGLDDAALSVVEVALESVLSWGDQATDSKEDLAECDAIVAFAFGSGPQGTPGQQNDALAAMVVAAMEATQNSLPVLVQWEIGDSLSQQHGVEPTFAATRNGHDRYLSSVDVARQFVAFARQERMPLRTVLLVAHPDHALRVREILVQHRLRVHIAGKSLLPKWQQFGCDQFGYTERSGQAWTRSRKEFIKHELWTRPKQFVRRV